MELSPRALKSRGARAALLLQLALLPAAACVEVPRDEPARSDSTRVSARDSLRDFLRDSIRDSLRDSLRDSMRDSLAGLLPDSEVLVAAPLVRAPGDTMPVAATEGDLEALGAALVIPVQGVVAADLRDSYLEARGGRVHEAIDIHAPRGTPVLAATDGRLLKLFDSKPGGLMVYASDASDRFIFMYGHLDRYAPGVTEGMSLRRGQVIGYVGTTGNAAPAGPHLHLAVARGRPSVAWWKGTPVNPYPLFVPGR